MTYLDRLGAKINCASSACVLTSGVYKFQVELNFPIPEDLTMNFSTEDFTGYSGIDYYAVQGTQQVAAGASSTSFLLNVHNSYAPGIQRSFKIHYRSPLRPAVQTQNIFLPQFDGAAKSAKATHPTFTQVKMSSLSTCALTDNNEVYCWGARETGPYTQSSAFGTKVSGITEDVTQIEVTSQNGCGLTASKKIQCWHVFEFLSFFSGSFPGAVDIPDFINVNQFSLAKDSFGYSTLCAVLANGTIRCAGYNNSGLLGNGATGSSSVSNLVQGFSNVGVDPVAKKVVMGNNFACALTSSGSVYCWGSNANGQLGIAPATTSATSAVLAASLPPMRDLFAGYSHICGATLDDRLLCWGANALNQLGLSETTASSYLPVEIPGLSGIESAALGTEVNCVLRNVSSVKKVYCWGRNTRGALAQPYWGKYLAPIENNLFSGAAGIAVSAQKNALCGIQLDGGVYCLGESSSEIGSELGHPFNFTSTVSISLPSNTKDNFEADDLVLQNFTRCVLDKQKNARCYGLNPLSVSPSMTRNDMYGIEPTLLSSAPLQSVAMGRMDEFQCYVDLDKKVWCRGQNDTGQLGDGTTNYSATFKQITSLSNIKAVTAGRNFACAISYQSEVYCWGHNGRGQVGFTSTAPHVVSTPRLMTNFPSGNITKIVASSMGACALMETGSIYCWGYSLILGNGTSSDSPTPTQVTSPQVFKDISAGYNIVCGVSTGAAIFCWGTNSNGAIGDGTTVDRLVPTQVSNSSGAAFTMVAPTYAGTCALTSVGEVYCWGFGTGGQLGNGATTSSNTPVKVHNLAGGVVKIVASEFFNTTGSQGNWSACALVKTDGQNQDVKCWGSTALFLKGVPQGSGITPHKLLIDSDSP